MDASCIHSPPVNAPVSKTTEEASYNQALSNRPASQKITWTEHLMQPTLKYTSQQIKFSFDLHLCKHTLQPAGILID